VTGSAAALFALPGKTRAQPSWPTRQIRIIVPYPAGGQTDGIARAFGDYLARQVGKPVIIENKAGAGGVIGVTEVRRAEPDGTTILCTISSSLIQNRVTVKDLPYDPEKDRRPERRSSSASKRASLKLGLISAFSPNRTSRSSRNSGGF
jgi:tripartite-type tricarboxylate transporter receptor subunit TctC